MSECLYFWQTLAHMTLNKHDDNDHDALYIMISETRHGNVNTHDDNDHDALYIVISDTRHGNAGM